MFYGSEHFETACLETIASSGLGNHVVSGVQFQCLRELRLLDLASITVLDSFFNNAWSYSKRHASTFMRSFADDISQPIERGKSHHEAYIPTQALTAFIRDSATTRDGVKYDGIKFRSSKDSQPCYVIFADRNACLPSVDSHRTEERLVGSVLDDSAAEVGDFFRYSVSECPLMPKLPRF